MNSLYTSFNNFIGSYGGSIAKLTLLSNNPTIDDSHLNNLNNKVQEFKDDAYLGSKASWWVKGASVSAGTIIHASDLTGIQTTITNMTSVKCRNRSRNSSGYNSVGCNSGVYGQGCSQGKHNQSCNKGNHDQTCSNSCNSSCWNDNNSNQCASGATNNPQTCHHAGNVNSAVTHANTPYGNGNYKETCGNTCRTKACSNSTNSKSCSSGTNSNTCSSGTNNNTCSSGSDNHGRHTNKSTDYTYNITCSQALFTNG